jgi:predicted 3-demethylubiquinone-9 3-methyltransferase (glyoxalase superfamily)
MQKKITTFPTFDGRAEEAADFYVEIDGLRRAAERAAVS